MPMSSSATWKLWWASVCSLPPLKPVQPKVVTSLRLAHSTARRMFGLLPEPLMAKARRAASASGGSLRETSDRREALQDAHVVYVKEWARTTDYGQTSLNDADREAAVRIGGEDRHLLKIEAAA